VGGGKKTPNKKEEQRHQKKECEKRGCAGDFQGLERREESLIAKEETSSDKGGCLGKKKPEKEEK